MCSYHTRIEGTDTCHGQRVIHTMWHAHKKYKKLNYIRHVKKGVSIEQIMHTSNLRKYIGLIILCLINQICYMV